MCSKKLSTTDHGLLSSSSYSFTCGEIDEISKTDLLSTANENGCGNCDYCDKAAESGIRMQEPPGALFCKLKQIKYETLDSLQRATYSRYVLNTGTVTAAATDVKDGDFGVGVHEVKSIKESTMIILPLILSEIFQELRRSHEDEIQNDEHFISVLNHMNVKNVKLNNLLDYFIREDLRIQRQTQVNQQDHVKVFATLKSLNAFELFSLLIIFLNRLPSPIFRLTTECSKMLLQLSAELPHDAQTVSEQKRKLIQSILDVSNEERGLMGHIADQIHQLFNVDSHSRKHNSLIKNRLFYSLNDNFSRIKQRMRRSMIRMVIRNARFELSRHMYSLFRKRRNITDSSKEKQYLMDTIFASEAANLAFCCGPVILRLSDAYDSRENRIKAMTSLLFHFDGSVMYCLEKRDRSFERAMSCHLHCPCGFGEPQNIEDPAFRKLFAGASYLRSRSSRRKKSPEEKPLVNTKKRFVKND